MRRITEIDITEMRSNGYDSDTIKQALESFERCKVADQLIEKIAAAFQGVTLGDGVGLEEAQGLDDYASEETCAAYRKTDEKDDWRKISSDALNRCSSSLCFFDPEGMRFHLPAFMTAELLGKYDLGLEFNLTQIGDYDRYYSLLNPEQRESVRLYLLFLRDDPDYEFDLPHIDRSLSNYWT